MEKKSKKSKSLNTSKEQRITSTSQLPPGTYSCRLRGITVRGTGDNRQIMFHLDYSSIKPMSLKDQAVMMREEFRERYPEMETAWNEREKTPENKNYPCHALPREQWCDYKGSGDFMGHTCLGKEKNAENEDYVSSGGIKYYVLHSKTKSYTAIGAKNVSHAFNKATKLFAGLWSSLQAKEPDQNSWTYISVVEFGELIKEHLKNERS